MVRRRRWLEGGGGWEEEVVGRRRWLGGGGGWEEEVVVGMKSGCGDEEWLW